MDRAQCIAAVIGTAIRFIDHLRQGVETPC